MAFGHVSREFQPRGRLVRYVVPFAGRAQHRARPVGACTCAPLRAGCAPAQRLRGVPSARPAG
eukprot:10893787-Alexandrium_andersonii.AAC.1